MLNEIRFALRTLARTPVFTSVAVLSLALGIGANTAIFSLIDQVLLRSAPVADPERVVVFHFEGVNQGSADADNNESVFAYPIYRDLRDRTKTFTAVIARAGAGVNVISNDQAEQARAEIVSGNFFEALGTRPALGRLLTPADDRTPGGHPVIVLSHGYWTRRFGGAASILNQTVRVNGMPMTVVGVTPRSFLSIVAGQTPDLYVPIAMKAQVTPLRDNLENRRSAWLNILARLKPGITATQAQASLAPAYRAILQEDLATMPKASERFRSRFMNNRLELRPAARGINQLEAQLEKPLGAVMAMVGLVLLIACANVANLLISRAAGRRREIAVRLAIGASRWMLMRQLLLESAVLSIAGGVVGLGLSSWIVDGLIGLAPADFLGGWVTAGIDARMLAFTFVVSVLTGLLFGLAPAMSATRPDLVAALREQGGTASRGQLRFRRALVAFQVALSLLLLVAAGLFVRTLGNLMRHNLGFRPERLLTFSVSPALSGYRGPTATTFFERLQERLGTLPGVVSVGAAELSPLGNNNAATNMTVEGYRAGEDEDTTCEVNVVSAGYFRTIGIPLAAGREFTAADSLEAPKVAIINETFAKYFFKDRNPLGRRIVRGAGNVTPDIEIVGVVKDSKHSSLRETTSRFYYLPYTQQKDQRRLTYFVRASRDDESLPTKARNIVRDLDRSVPLTDARWMQTRVDDSLYIERLIASLAAAFGGLATLLAVVGLYGVIAYLAARRTVEIGVRMALGATRGNILRLVMRDAGITALAGLLVGVPCALAAGGAIESQLFGIHANDPWVIAGAALALAGAALLAAYIPARRAASLDPLRALRYE